MGYYLNPANKVPSVGRQIHGAASYNEAVASLRSGEVLVGLYDRVIFKNAPWLHSKSEWEEFEQQYRSGAFVSKAHFAVPLTVANKLGANIPADRGAP